ncbi:alkaline phosphatase [Priestia taiwanensis]|uniref:Alkaline phosphatase n=1 Tax=Priestia taiwanensis TaxID=1347902 RepID=A0A917AJM7_9BACI|nr:alkaline phosphatase [Priestia taiwanensis]MBM7361765.1 alkaline phosphatase [Priestia taiwanensis]GGE56803.1 alkaline phosphatase [Priestia taiwanensis]
MRKIIALCIMLCYFYTPHVQAEQSRVKNVILMIPDGFSTAYATNYRWYKGRNTVMDAFLVGMARTYSASSKVTDSAAAGTAMATGVKTTNGMISMSPDGKKLKTILEAAKEEKKATGLVVTATITHATPAVFAAHVPSRWKEEDIAPQMLQQQIDVLLGGGLAYFIPKKEGGESQTDLIDEAKKKGYTFVRNKHQLLAAQEEKVLGLFAEKDMAPELERDNTIEPSLAEMTSAALTKLSKHPQGFFLMVEGSQIDKAGHHHDAAWAMKDIEAFEDAVEKAIEFAKQDGETLVVVVGDHDTGGFSVGGYGKYEANPQLLHTVKKTGHSMMKEIERDENHAKEIIKHYTNISFSKKEVDAILRAEKEDIALNTAISKKLLLGWTSTVHTGVDVPVYAYGPGRELFRGLIQNTDVALHLAKLMGVSLQKT